MSTISVSMSPSTRCPAMPVSVTPGVQARLCPACGDRPGDSGMTCPQYEFATARGVKMWSQCGHCRSYFMLDEYAPESEADHTRQMAWGQQDAGTRLNDFKSAMFQAALNGIERYGAQPGHRLLDVGCSFGGFLMNARDRGFQGAGLDIVPEAVEFVRSQGFAAEACASLTECSLFSAVDRVDVLSVLDAHIYWPDQRRELQAAHSLLHHGGLLVMRAITKSHFISAGRMVKPVLPGLSHKLIRRAVTDHRFCMPLKSLLTTIQESGFRIESATPHGAGHSAESSLAVRALFGLGTLSWHTARIAIAPGALIIARKIN